MTLHERLKDLKDKRNMLQKDIATALGISLRAYQYYERGEREPTASVLIAMSDYLYLSEVRTFLLMLVNICALPLAPSRTYWNHKKCLFIFINVCK